MRDAPAADCADALGDDLGWALGVLLRSYQRAAGPAFAGVPGGPRGYQVLAAAARTRPGSQQELAGHLGVDRTVMTYLLDDLERGGLIERRLDPADRRARRIAVTDAGRDVLASLEARLRAADESVLAGLPDPGDRLRFRAMLRALATRAGPPGPPGDLPPGDLPPGDICAAAGPG
jgi:DNA-binding MarR family transcriptional regulator